jgi:predicted Zn-dependent protease
MMIEDKILLVARYVENDLDEAEKTVFENRLLTDVELQQHLARYHDIHQSLKMQLANDANDKQFKATLKELNKRHFKTETKVISFRPILKWASGIAAILVIGLFIWSPWRDDPFDQLLNESTMQVTERGADQLSDLDKASDYFNDKNYPAAKVLLQKLYTADPTNAMVAYHYGLTLAATNSPKEGRDILIKLYNGESVFKYDSAYAIALSYLNEDKTVDGKTWLQKIPKGTRLYDQAIALKEKL